MQRVILFFIWTATVVALFFNAQRAAAEGYHNAYVAEFELPPSASAPHPPQWVYVLPDGYPIHRLRGSEDKLIYYQPEEQYPVYPVASAVSGLSVAEVETVDGVGMRTQLPTFPTVSSVLVEKPGFVVQARQPNTVQEAAAHMSSASFVPPRPADDDKHDKKPKDPNGNKDGDNKEKGGKDKGDKGDNKDKKDEGDHKDKKHEGDNKDKKDEGGNKDKKDDGDKDKDGKEDKDNKKDKQGNGEKEDGDEDEGSKDGGGDQGKESEEAGEN